MPFKSAKNQSAGHNVDATNETLNGLKKKHDLKTLHVIPLRQNAKNTRTKKPYKLRQGQKTFIYQRTKKLKE